MSEISATPEIKNVRDFLSFFIRELKPKGPIFTPFNVITIPIILLGLVLIVYRFTAGLGAVTNLSQEIPWGLWIGFDVITGVAFAAGGYVVAFMVYIIGGEKYHSIARAAILSSFLAYVFYAGGIILDVGRWWNIVNPMIGRKFGVNAVMFLVAWHFFLYMVAAGLEFSPAAAEWLGMKRLRKILASLTLGAVIFGVALSTLHQSGLGALMSMAKGKIHPLWYTEFIPVLFFVSSIFAGLSVVIFKEMICHKVFKEQIDEEHRKSFPDIIVSLGKICAVVMFGYFFLKVMMFVHDRNWPYLNTPMGYWYLTEVIGLVLIPCFMFVHGAQTRNLPLILAASTFTMIGIIMNRLNYVFIAYNWQVPVFEKYYPTWMEFVITLTIIFTELWVYRWVVNRMAVFQKPPEWAVEMDKH
jgi:Ni/Fe-hydrogenase subunit HybB-like protein